MSQPTEIDPKKYIVFKRADYLKKSSHIYSPHEALSGEIEDAVVIRRQDIFAAPPLYTYASSIQTALEILEMMDPGNPRVFPLIQYMEQVRDYFQHQADLSNDHPSRKLPD